MFWIVTNPKAGRMQRSVSYELSPNADQVASLLEVFRDYSDLCNWLADIVRRHPVGVTKKVMSVKVARVAVLGLPELNEVTKDGFKIIPSRYVWLALTRVIGGLGRDKDRRYTAQDYVDVDSKLARFKLNNELNQPFDLVFSIKEFRTADRVRLDVPCRYCGEVEGFDWLPLGNVILVHNRNIWRVVVAVDVPDDDD